MNTDSSKCTYHDILQTIFFRRSVGTEVVATPRPCTARCASILTPGFRPGVSKVPHLLQIFNKEVELCHNVKKRSKLFMPFIFSTQRHTGMNIQKTWLQTYIQEARRPAAAWAPTCEELIALGVITPVWQLTHQDRTLDKELRLRSPSATLDWSFISSMLNGDP